MPELGKPGPDFMQNFVYRNLGAKRTEVLVGPRRGSDNAFVALKGGGVMVVTTDPVSVAPQIGSKMSAWLSAHLIASDLATSGVCPTLACFSFNFPVEMSSMDEGDYLKGIGDACKELGVAIVSGHTGTYPGAGYGVVGGGVMMGFTTSAGYVDPSMARFGDSIVMTKGAGIEAAAYLANSFPKFTDREVGKKSAGEARKLIDQCSIVKDALSASSVGLRGRGVTSMHDATEGGVLGAIREMSDASGLLFRVDTDSIFVSNAVRKVCAAFSIDPLTSLSEGTLILTCRPNKTKEVIARIEERSIHAYEIGFVEDGKGVWAGPLGKKPKPVRSTTDGYWNAYQRSLAEGLD
jgi:hydrogenase expression/formation protein HypE